MSFLPYSVLTGSVAVLLVLLLLRSIKRLRSRQARTECALKERDEQIRRHEQQLEETVATRTADLAQVNEALARKTAFLEALLNASLDGIIVLDPNGKEIFQNRRNIELWEIPQSVVDADDVDAQIRHVMSMLKYPEQIARKLRHLEAHLSMCFREEVELARGTVLDTYSSPVTGTDGTHYGRILTFHDITERKLTNKALRQSEATLKSVLAASQVGFAVLSLDRTIEWISDGMNAITGYTLEETKTHNLQDLYENHEEFLRVGESIYSAVKSGEVGIAETRWVRKDGTALDIRLSAAAINSKDPSTRVVFTAVDMTPHERAKAELRESEARYRLLFDESPIGLVELDVSAVRAEISRLRKSGITDLSGYLDAQPVAVQNLLSFARPIHINRAALRLYDASDEEDFRKFFEELLTHGPARVLKDDLLAIAEMEGDFDWETFSVTTKGRRIYVVSRWSIIPGCREDEMRILISLSDMTQRKEAEDALRTSQLQLSEAMELAHIVYWELNPVTEMFILNDPFYAFFDTTAEQEGGYVVDSVEYGRRFMHPDDVPLLKEATEKRHRCRDREFLNDVEHRIIRRDGEVRHIAVRIRATMDEDGRLVRCYGANQDITNRKVAEETLQKVLAELESKNKDLEKAYADLQASHRKVLQQEKMASIGVLAAGVAHEINNPMGFIISNLNSLRKYIEKIPRFITAQSEAIDTLSRQCNGAGESEVARVKDGRRSLKIDYILEDSRNLLEESLDGADRVKRIVQDLKNFSRIDGADTAPTDLNKVLDSTVNIVWNEIKHKATLNKQYGKIPLVQGNHGQLSQVFMNILVNAAQAIVDSGEIVIRTSQDDGFVRVTISDTGRGIPEDQLNRIFEPFYTTKEIGKGTGLGLSIAYDIVGKHHGRIEVVSKVGEGTTFTVMLPVGGC
jgi:PAS domain S-box-containing protein